MDLVRVKFQFRHEVLLAKREALGLTQAGMANYLGVHIEQYSHVECLHLNLVSPVVLEKISSELGIDVATLFPQWLSLYGQRWSQSRTYLTISNEAILKIAAPSSRLLDQEDLTTDIKAALKPLSDRQQYVLIHYFGLFDTQPETLEEIGNHLGVIRERVRQIKERAIRDIRHGKGKAIVLRSYLGELGNDEEGI